MQTALATILAGMIASGTAEAADLCRPDAGDGEAVTVAGVTDDGLVRLGDGRLVRLAGLERLPRGTALPDGAEATLLPAAAPDRHGAIPGDLVVDGRSLSEDLVGRGLLRIRPAAGAPPCPKPLFAAEGAARAQSLGVWADPGYGVADASDPSAVARLEGQFAIVAGRVRHVGATRDRYWIDFGDDWRSDVTVVVPKAESPRFLAAGLGVGALGGARIRVRGIVTIKDGPRLDVTEPAAIERLTDG